MGEYPVSDRVSALSKTAASMIIFGSIGLFVKNIPLSSGSIAFTRALVGTLFLAAIVLLRKKERDWSAIGKNLPLLLLSGAAIGANWIFLFESYRHTSVAVSTLCYYTAPILVVLLSPLVLKEHLSRKKLLCVGAAVVGIALVSNVFSQGVQGSEYRGIVLGLCAAGLYAGAILMNKRIQGIASMDRTIIQLGTAALVLIPYNLLSSGFTYVPLTPTQILLLVTVGIVHTGLAYYLYFSSMRHLSGQTVAIVSYLDPVVAVLVSACFLKEPFSWREALGALLIIGAALLSELSFPRKEGAK